MTVDTSISHHFVRSTTFGTWSLLGLVVSIVFSYNALFLGTFDDTFRPGAAKLVSCGFLLIAPFWTISIWRAFRESKLPSIEISNEGLLDRRVMHSAIPWSEISGFRVMSRGNILKKNSFISVSLKEASSLRKRQYLDQIVFHYLNHFSSRKLVLNPLHLESSFEALKHVFEAFWTKNKSCEATPIAPTTN